MTEKRLALLGFGNGAQAFAKMLLDKHQEIKERYDVDIKVSAVATRSKGNLMSYEGIDLSQALDDVRKNGRFSDRLPLTGLDTIGLVKRADYDVLVEMTPLEIFTGEPAISHIEEAFRRGKDVITANKGPVAWKYRTLKELAKANGCKFFYETTVMDGTPVFDLVEKTLKMTKVTEISGILNSTTNFILEEMAKGHPYEEIIMRGRKCGFIEADPAMDTEGYDAAAKLTVLLNVLMDENMTPDMVKREGIENVTLEKIRQAADRGNVIKLLCRGLRKDDGSIAAEVKPHEVPAGDMLAAVTGTTSVVSVTTDLMGKISIVEHDPGIEQTAYGIFSDMLRILDE